MIGSEWPRTTREWYLSFAEEAGGNSPTYERLSRTVADDADLLGRLDNDLPESKRQPNLLFGATRYLGGPVDDPVRFRGWAVEHWDDLADVMRQRRTQTKTAGRTAGRNAGPAVPRRPPAGVHGRPRPGAAMAGVGLLTSLGALPQGWPGSFLGWKSTGTGSRR